ncbi:MAG TPA: glycosyltransferase family 2 protein [Nitrospirae bacterium]|nr:undecaprenyl-phosphate mannosyltransferase [bacterium BMS3Abin06]HDH13613.1 glycosyltransferase family 2 protein [Nitrospirota bacterium]HDZ01193.1 glycosyltransferase family 2 protein [Nitrospirota bacterium]
MRVLIVIPAFNEAGNIQNVIHDLRQHFPQAEPLIINDGSQDNTSIIARSSGARVIDLPYNLGIGGAVQTGIIYARRENFDVVIQFDGDGQHMAEEIEKILEPVAGGTDICVGSRFCGANEYIMPLTRRIGTKVFSIVISLICGQKLTDTTSGFRAYGKQAIELFSAYYPEDYPEVEALIIAHKKKLNIREVSVKMRQRSEGKSSITPLRAVYYMIKVLLAVFIDLLKK